MPISSPQPTSAKATHLPFAEPVVIIGAGPAGLTAAYELQEQGQTCVLLERDKVVGGLSRTVRYKNYGFDIGGHRFFTKIDRADRLWRKVLGEDFIRVPRLSRILYRGKFFRYPLQPWNAFWGLGPWNTLAVLASYARAKLRPRSHEEYFDHYIINRFGRRLYEIFFKTYTEKVWGIPCSQIRSEWAAQRIQGLSLIKAIRNAFFGKADGSVKTLIEEFDYPRLGPGMLWERVADLVQESGSTLHLGREVREIWHDDQQITRIVHVDPETGEDEQVVSGSAYLSTMPLRTLIDRLHPAAPREIIDAAHELRYRDFLTVNLILKQENLFPDNWIYIHSPDVRVGRIQNFGNWSRELVPEPNRSSIGMEYFCFEGDDLWMMEDADLLALARAELEELGLARSTDVVDGFVMRVKKAYPMYNGKFGHNLETLKKYLSRFKNLQLLGRNGLHKYNNQDHSMLTGFLAADNLLHGQEHDIWLVNTDTEYHEIRRMDA